MYVDQKSREISAVDLYPAPTINVNNSTNIDPFDLIQKWGHDTTILYLSNSSFAKDLRSGSEVAGVIDCLFGGRAGGLYR
jgi:hypothetical protein